MIRLLRYSILIIFAFLYEMSATAQKRKADKTGPVIVVGKTLSTSDSVLVKQLYLDGLHAKMMQNTQQSTDYFRRVLSIDPANDAAMFELAAIYYLKNQTNEAEIQIRNAVTVKPENKWYWLLLADIYKQTNNANSLLPVFNELIRLEPYNEDHYFDKANSLVILNKINEANAVYDEIERLYGTSEFLTEARQRVFLKQGKPEKVAAELEKQVKLNPKDIKPLLNLAEVYTRTGSAEKSVILLKKALATEPENALLRLSLADAYRSLKQFDESLIELKQAFNNSSYPIDEKIRIVLGMFPQFADIKVRSGAHDLAEILTKVHSDDAKSFSVFGDVLFQEQKLEEATASYRLALKINDQVYQIWEQLLRIGLSGNKFKEVIADGETALSIFPNQAALYLYTAIAYAQTKDHTKAINYLETAASLESEDKDVIIQVYSGLGDSYNALKKFKQSDEAYRKVLELSPDNSYTLNNFAYYLSLRGDDLEKAEQMSKQSIQLEPNNPSFEDTYGWILFKLKKFKEARVWIEKSISHGENNSAVQIEHYGDVLYLTGEKDKALQQWQKANQIGGASDKLQLKLNGKKYIE
ncbi:MAG: tetratricopeptide repeat protein [Flavobacterium sp.]|nr:tetratricopeptide repeat protein [Pedobacter sp.]